MSHHSSHTDKNCKYANVSNENPPIDLGSSEDYSLKKLSELLMGSWSTEEAKIFAKALQVCGKNFSAIKKDFLPWKSVRSIIEFYYYSIDKDTEQKKKIRNSDKKNKSPLDENKKKKNSKENEPENKKSDDKQDVQETSNGNGDNLTTESQTDNYSNQEETSKDDNNNTDSNTSVNNKRSTTSPNSSIVADDIAFKAINGNHLNTDHKRNNVPGQEVRPIKAKPILQSDFAVGDDNLALNNSTLGSLNLYLHGELVLKLNAQQQDSGQKWVESMEVPPKKKRSLMTNNNGMSGSGRLSGLKRSIDSKGHLFKEDGDDFSTCVGDVSGSDDDSLTSNESSSVVASSPSSSSTINSAAKKARVKVENLSSISSNGTSISPTNTNRKSDRDSGSGNIKQRTCSPLGGDNEMEMKKKFLEANLFRIENGHFYFNSSAMSGVFEPPKAHSNSATISPQYPLHHQLQVNASPVKSISKSESMNGHANGFSTGPVDLTRKPTNGHSELLSGSSLHSPSRQRHLHSNSSPVPKAAHEASNSSTRFLSSSLFSPMPAPPLPPLNFPASPNGHSKHLKKSLFRTGGVQFAK